MGVSAGPGLAEGRMTSEGPSARGPTPGRAQSGSPGRGRGRTVGSPAGAPRRRPGQAGPGQRCSGCSLREILNLVKARVDAAGTLPGVTGRTLGSNQRGRQWAQVTEPGVQGTPRGLAPPQTVLAQPWLCPQPPLRDQSAVLRVTRARCPLRHGRHVQPGPGHP